MPSGLVSGLLNHGLGEDADRLLELCAAAQVHHGEEPFFLGCRQAAQAIGIDFRHANGLLNLFIADGTLEVVQKGNAHRATRYRMKANVVLSAEEQR